MNKNYIIIALIVGCVSLLSVLNMKSLMNTPKIASENLNFYALYDLLHDPQVDPYSLTTSDYETLLKDYEEQVLMPGHYVGYFTEYESIQDIEGKFVFFRSLKESDKLKILKGFQSFSKSKPNKRDRLRSRFKQFQELTLQKKMNLIEFWLKWKRLAHPIRKKRLKTLNAS